MILWARVGNTIVGALYHPPCPLYTADSLLDYIEACQACLDELFCEFPSTSVVLAGDFNQLDDNSVVERTGFAQLVQQATCGQNILNRIFVSGSMYESIRVVTPVMRCSSLCRTRTAHRESDDKETIPRSHAGTTCFIFCSTFPLWTLT